MALGIPDKTAPSDMASRATAACIQNNTVKSEMLVCYLYFVDVELAHIKIRNEIWAWDLYYFLQHSLKRLKV